jgi:hypothetical protein
MLCRAAVWREWGDTYGPCTHVSSVILYLDVYLDINRHILYLDTSETHTKIICVCVCVRVL